MTARSIFQKICPACMVTLSLDARECACGHRFDHDDTDATLSSEEIRLKAEELYENYLAARAEQAAGAVMAAQAEFARDPGNAQKSQRIARAIEEAEQARAALAEQSARVAEMRKALPSPAARPVHVPPAPKKQTAGIKPVATPSPSQPTARVVSDTAADTDNAITTSRLARRAARKTAPAKTRPAPLATKPEIAPPPAQTRTPNPAFRRAQAARAEKILRQAKTAVAVKEVIRKETVVVPPPPAIPEAGAASPTAPVLTRSAPRLLGADVRECPNCTASVDGRLNRCRCGYEFPSGETLIPALAMSEEERAEFAKLFKLP